MADRHYCTCSGRGLSECKRQRSAGVWGGDVTQQGARVARIKDGSERGTFGERVDQQFVKHLQERVNIFVAQRARRHKRRTLSRILSPSAAMTTGVTERSMYANE